MYIPPRKPKPKKRAYEIREIPAFRRWIKTRRCAVKGCQNLDIDPAHLRWDLPADALKGGTGIKPGDSWLVPLCRKHHDDQHAKPKTFNQEHDITPEVAERLFELWQRETEPGRRWQREHREAAE